MSRAVSSRYGVPCPTCNVGPHQPCRTRGSRRVTDTHAARIAAAHAPVLPAAATEGDTP